MECKGQTRSKCGCLIPKPAPFHHLTGIYWAVTPMRQVLLLCCGGNEQPRGLALHSGCSLTTFCLVFWVASQWYHRKMALGLQSGANSGQML